MSGATWSETEVETLREVFPASRWRDILPRLPRRTRTSITQQARALGIQREICKRTRWSELEERRLSKMWPVADEAEIVAAFPGRRWASIGRKACALAMRRRLPGARKNARFIQPLFVALRLERERQAITRSKLAAIVGYHTNQLHAWEMGKATPRFDAVIAWAAALRLEIVMRSTAEQVLLEQIAMPSKAKLMAGR